MMRKTAALLLAVLSLLLAACGMRPVMLKETTVPPSETAPETAVSADKPVILPDGPLPQTAYAPPSTPPRLYEEIAHTLIPGDSYGRIWPYMGGYVVSWWMPGALLGICDDRGRIVCDPVYNHVQFLEKDGRRLYVLTEYRADGFCLRLSQRLRIRQMGRY